jgi:hypothetical protein
LTTYVADTRHGQTEVERYRFGQREKTAPTFLSSCALPARKAGHVITLVQNRELDALALWQRYGWGIGTVADDENVLLTSGESVASTITDGDNIERTRVLLHAGDNTDTASVASLGDHGKLSNVELDEIDDLASGDVNLDNIVHLDGWVRVADGPAVVRDNIRNFLDGHLLTLDTAELVLLLIIIDAVKNISALGIIDQTELITSLWDLNDVLETGREARVGADLTIDLHVLGKRDDLGLLARQGILESVSQNQDKR